MIKILCIGKKHDKIYEAAISYYEDRLKHYTKVEWMLLPHSSQDGDAARKEEATRLLNSIKPNDYVFLLDETGENISSPEIANRINRAQSSSQDICVIIGGAYGVDSFIKNRSQVILAFGKTVFPHQLMRVMTLEQLYRAYSILAGGKYHHE